MPFLNVALTSRISATMTVVGSSKSSRCADGEKLGTGSVLLKSSEMAEVLQPKNKTPNSNKT
jgi:hypothetical protein